MRERCTVYTHTQMHKYIHIYVCMYMHCIRILYIYHISFQETHLKLCPGVFVLPGLFVLCLVVGSYQSPQSSLHTPPPRRAHLSRSSPTSNTHSGVVSRHCSLELLPALAPSSEPSAESIAVAGTIGCFSSGPMRGAHPRLQVA